VWFCINLFCYVCRDPLYVGDEIKTEVEPNFEQEDSHENNNESYGDILTLEEVSLPTFAEHCSSRLQNNEFQAPIVIENEPILNSKCGFQQQQSTVFQISMPSSSASHRNKGGRPKPKNDIFLVKIKNHFYFKKQWMFQTKSHYHLVR